MSEWRAHYTEWLDEIEAAQPGLNRRVSCVCRGRRIALVEQNGGYVISTMKMTPENDGTSARRLLVRDCWEDRRRSLFLLSFDVSIANQNR